MGRKNPDLLKKYMRKVMKLVIMDIIMWIMIGLATKKIEEILKADNIIKNIKYKLNILHLLLVLIMIIQLWLQKI